MSTYQIAAEARFLLANSEVSPEQVWSHFSKPLQDEKEGSWHPSFPQFKTIARHPDGRPWQFLLEGSSGGRYPFHIEQLDERNLFLLAWMGPSSNPPSGHKELFVGGTYGVRVLRSCPVIVEIFYAEEWRSGGFGSEKQPLERSQHEITWIARKFPWEGVMDYLRPCDPKRVPQHRR